MMAIVFSFVLFAFSTMNKYFYHKKKLNLKQNLIWSYYHV